MRALVLMLSLMLLPAVAFADPPFTIHEAPQYMRVSGPVYSPAWTMGTSSDVMRASTGTTTPAIFAWDSIVTICSSAAVNCAFSMTSSVTLGAAGAATMCEITDASGPDGPAACMHIPAAGCVSAIPMLGVMRNAPGARSGACSGLMRGRNGQRPIRAPCSADADCIDAGHSPGTTCTAAPSDAQLLQGGAMLICRGAASAVVSARVER